MLGEPLSFPADVLLAQLNESQPGVPVIGGMASGGWGVGENRLILGGEERAAGAVAVLVHGPVAIKRSSARAAGPSASRTWSPRPSAT